MSTRLHRAFARLPVVRGYARALETAFDIMGPDGRQEFRRRIVR